MGTAYGNMGTYATPRVPPIPICPQEPWEAQEYAHRDRSRVKLSFCVSPAGAATCNPPLNKVTTCARRRGHVSPKAEPRPDAERKGKKESGRAPTTRQRSEPRSARSEDDSLSHNTSHILTTWPCTRHNRATAAAGAPAD
jgi:hypothetical protein